MSFYGPVLPPTSSEDSSNTEDQSPSYGPSLPPDIGPSIGPSLGIGPSLPPDIGPSYGPSLPSDIGPSYGPSLPSDIGPSYGPSLPPNIGPSFGPSLPPNIGPSLPNKQSFHDDTHNIPRGHSQAIPEEEELTHDIIGPLPPSLLQTSQLSEKDTRKQEIEARMKQMKDKLNRKDNHGPTKPVREEWMMELPPEINPNVGTTSMTSRKFRTKYTEIGDRSVWTDTPADKARKAREGHKKQQQTNEEDVAMSKRDKIIAQEVEQYNKEHRGTSLVELHRKRKAETQSVDDGGQGTERRPFDRDIDLQLPHNIMTDAKRKTLIKDSAKSLDSKFSRGKQQFL